MSLFTRDPSGQLWQVDVDASGLFVTTAVTEATGAALGNTASDIITSAFMLIGMVADGETTSVSQRDRAIGVLNDLVDSWNAEHLLLHRTLLSVFPLVAGTQDYTLGTGGTMNMTRPAKVDKVGIIYSDVERPITIASNEEWASIRRLTQSGIPTFVRDDGGNPLRTLSFYPVPNAACSAILFSREPLDSAMNLATVLNLPVGYKRALRYGLAVDLAAEFNQPTPLQVAVVAEASKYAIRSLNTSPMTLRCDLAAPSITPNIYSGDF